MDFFDRQDRARKKTKLLVAYFVIAVACIIALVYLASLLVFSGIRPGPHEGGPPPGPALWNPTLLLYVTLGTLAVIAVGSLYKTAALARGGSAIAESLGGRLLGPDTSDLHEQKLRNVVEEMAIAAGVPVPKIYVLDQEHGINAFAAGYSPGDAAIGVTRGCVTSLDRDELQGVIGHEFSHILNGDMRLNLRLIGVIFGILCLAVIGRILLYSRSRGNKNPQVFLGLALVIIGSVGVFFGRLIQAAVCRQREFLADAASVQFTRNPAGISGALQKIGAAGSRLASPHAGEASHMLFGNGLSDSFLGLLATHPPLAQRIRAIDPAWDGKYRSIGEAADGVESPRRAAKRPSSPLPILPIPGMPSAQPDARGFAPSVVQMGAVLPALGQPTMLHLRYAEDLRNSLPEAIQSALRKPMDAAALVHALVLSREESLRAKQLTELAARVAPAARDRTAALWAEAAPIAARARLPLVNLALPALRGLRPDEFQRFSQALQWLIESDRKIDLFEFVLQKIVRRHLAPQFGVIRPAAVKYHTLKPLLPDCSVALSALANAGSSDPDAIEKAFLAGAPYVRAREGGLQFLPREACGLPRLDAALDRLAQAVPQIKKNLLDACLHVVGADGVIQEREAELLRAIAEALDCPIPPFLQASAG